MAFVDEVKISVASGRGGHGCLSFRREKYVPRGGPDGGDGGDGGSVFLMADAGMTSLIDFRYKPLYKAENGVHGQGSNCHGKHGEDLIIKVPVGTCVYIGEEKVMFADLIESGQKVLLATGGKGGLGNTRFKSSVNRAPRHFTKGGLAEELTLRLELRLLADVGLLGLPNAGKSSFIQSVSEATPRVADYPFTTLRPHLGVVRVSHEKQIVLADIPGLVAGAADGVGLGHQFLRHLSRCAVLLHIVDVAVLSPDTLYQDYAQVLVEMHRFDSSLLDKPRLLLLNKIDLLSSQEKDSLTGLIDACVSRSSFSPPSHILRISAQDKLGTDKVVKCLAAIVSADDS